MRALTDHEKRTIRIGAIVLLVYLVLMYGIRGWGYLERQRSEYQRLVLVAQQLREQLYRYEKKALVVQQLKQNYQLEPGKLTKATLVAEASAAIQNAASRGGVQLGPIRESSARASGKELTSMQLEGVGMVPAVMALMYRLETLGYPILIDSVQITQDPSKPGMVKVNLTVVILDFEQWKMQEARHA